MNSSENHHLIWKERQKSVRIHQNLVRASLLLADACLLDGSKNLSCETWRLLGRDGIKRTGPRCRGAPWLESARRGM